jgi:hypothetical protein
LLWRQGRLFASALMRLLRLLFVTWCLCLPHRFTSDVPRVAPFVLFGA